MGVKNKKRKQKPQRPVPDESERMSPGDLHDILQDVDPTWNGEKPEAGPPIHLSLPPGALHDDD